MRSIFLLLACVSFTAIAQNNDWLTYYERSGFTRTPRYDQTIEYCKRLDRGSPWIKYLSFGKSPQGRPMPLVILSKDRAFTPAAARAARKPVILIQSGIHAGEIDGKDASLMLMREIAITKKLEYLIDNAILLFVPIFNVDGHERFGPYNRINQNGPEEMGWRTTAQNLNLNRDYMKADAPEMRAMLKLFTEWLPDLYIDCHVTNGIDFQYDITYAAETWQNSDPDVASWITGSLLPHALSRVEAAGHRIFYYVFPREEKDLGKGLGAGPAPPRFSTGYAAIQNRPAILVETHVLKPYKTRVSATYHFLIGLIERVNTDRNRLHEVIWVADTRSERGPMPTLPVAFRQTENSVMREFLAIKSRTERSMISGDTRLIYTGEPETVVAPFFGEAKVVDSVTVPAAYLIPQEWTTVLDVLRAHGVSMRSLVKPETLAVDSYILRDVKFRSRPYEGRFGVTSLTADPVHEIRTYPAGTWIVPTAQRSAKVAIHLLEPRAPDSFIAWGFFNSIFEQKEYAENYVMEGIAPEMLAAKPSLREEFDLKIMTDSTFAKSPQARLAWLYDRSPWRDQWLNKYPVGKITNKEVLNSLQ